MTEKRKADRAANKPRAAADPARAAVGNQRGALDGLVSAPTCAMPAVLAREGATVMVVLSALRLLRFVDKADPDLTQLNDGALAHGPQHA